jgi:hypothetical protein
VAAWRCANPTRTARYHQYAKELAEKSGPFKPAPLDQARTARARAVLATDERPPLDTLTNEALLIHGSAPESLHAILFAGLDPQLAQQGLFGKGTYLAAKSNGYVSVDNHWRGNEEGLVGDLHRGLYAAHVRHEGEVFYLLICRAALGNYARTRSEDTQGIFRDKERTRLKGGKHSLVAEPLGRAREIVLFNAAALNIEYLMADKRERQWCNCGHKLLKRTVGKEGPNKHRVFLFCPDEQQGKSEGCGVKLMLPLCDCGRTACAKAKRDGSIFFKCAHHSTGYGRDCGFVDWNIGGKHTGGQGGGCVTGHKRHLDF